jgi:hypothetical protein
VARARAFVSEMTPAEIEEEAAMRWAWDLISDFDEITVLPATPRITSSADVALPATAEPSHRRTRARLSPERILGRTSRTAKSDESAQDRAVHRLREHRYELVPKPIQGDRGG